MYQLEAITFGRTIASTVATLADVELFVAANLATAGNIKITDPNGVVSIVDGRGLKVPYWCM